MLFISYSTRDQEEAQSICRYLDEAKVEYWISCERLDGEENWQSEVSHAIHQCTSFLILLSRNVRKRSDQLIQELAIANSMQREGLKIFGLSLDGDTFWRRPGGFEYVLRSKEVRDCSQGAQIEIERLVSSIRAFEEVHGESRDEDLVGAQKTIASIDGSSSGLLDLAVRMLSSFYGLSRDSLIAYGGRVFPDLVFPAASSVRGFDQAQFVPIIQEKCALDLGPGPEELPVGTSVAAQVANFFAKVPVNYPCYMNREMRLNERGEITGIDMFVGTRKQNVMTTSTLRNEFYLTYAKLRDEGCLDTVSVDEFAGMSPRRVHALEACGEGLSSLLKGASGYSEFGVQGVVLMPIAPTRRDGNLFSFRSYSGEFWAPVIRRSSLVEEQPGFYQFAPCGGFGMIGSPTSELTRLSAVRDFDLFNALMYRFCDELFTGKSVADGAEGPNLARSRNRALLREGDALADNDHYLEMLDLIEQGLVEIEFLGVSSSLISLKSDLVFAIVIRDPDYYARNRSSFWPNREASELTFLPLSVLASEEFIESNMAEEIAGPLSLLHASPLMEGLLVRC